MTAKLDLTPKFGPSGHSESFLNEFSSTIQMPKWLSARNLELFEYSFGKGVRISRDTACAIGAEAATYGIEISVHAPYFINFASVEPEKANNSITYLTASLKALSHFGGHRCVFHAGAEGGQPRIEAFARVKDMFSTALDKIAEEGLDHLIVCPETMGKGAQIGTVDEVIELCTLAPNVYPCLDFGHINALCGGTLKTPEDYSRIIDKLFDRLGDEKTKNMHVHFSRIQYGPKGEIRHLTFADNVYGPYFEDFAECIVKYSLTPHILSESAGSQAEDAASMKGLWHSAYSKITH